MSGDLTKRLGAMPRDKLQAVLTRLREKSGAPPKRMARTEVHAGMPYPLSTTQERVWFLCQLSPESAIYNNPLAMRLTAEQPINPRHFEQGLQLLGRRHAALRTSFHQQHGRPVQIVQEDAEFPVVFDDLSALSECERMETATKIARAQGSRSFDLARSPLLHCRLLRLSERDYILLLNQHHLISDGWSNMILARDLSAIMDAIVRGTPASVPQPAYQYVDFVQWEKQWLESEACRASLAFWKAKFAEPPPPLRLPRDYPRPPSITHVGAMVELDLELEFRGALARFCQENNVTLFQLLLAGFTLLLHRYTGQNEVVVGIPVANRNQREFQDIIGLFTNTLAFRSRFEPGVSFREHLHRVRHESQEAMAHQELPFSRLIEAVNPPRGLETQPIFQVMLAQQTVPSALKRFKVDYGVSKFELNLWFEEAEDGVSLTLTYFTDLYSRATAQRLLQHLRTLLENGIAAPETPVERLRFLAVAERETLLAAMSSIKGETRGGTVISRFEAQVAATPDAVAVRHGNLALTYDALNRRANQLARRLRAAGIRPECAVAVLMERTPLTLVALLAIMKAGAAYLPLDPAMPPAGLNLILGNAKARWLVTDAALAQRARELPATVLAADDPTALAEDDSNAGPFAQPDNAAYIIYTSGTTGARKGVCVEHRHLLSYCDAVWERMKLAEGYCFATLSSLAADLGNTMIFPPLLFGGCIDVIAPVLVTDAAGLGRYFAQFPADCLKIVPSHLRALLDSPEAGLLLPRKLLVLGGETAFGDLIQRVRGLRPTIRILNHYGPTETTIGASTYEVLSGEADSSPQQAVPIGFPLRGTRIYLLDQYSEPVPAGFPGEICIAGTGVARGYWQDEALSAQRFGADPFASGERLYRTGDRGRLRTDGAIEFLGRTDRQIKIRGFRVELTEIESVLAAHPGIEQAVVTAPVEGDPRQQMTAYLKRKNGSSPEIADCHDFLRSRLPEYMIPARIVFLEAVPLTSNGKVDYGALNQISTDPGAIAGITAAHNAPCDWIELAMRELWLEVLHLEHLGTNENFFSIGGHSLLAVQLLSRVRMRFGVELPLVTLFTHGTVAQMAALIRSGGTAVPQTPLVTIRRGGTSAPLFLVHPAGGNVLCYYDLAHSIGDRPVFGLQVVPAPMVHAGGLSIEKMAEDYLAAVLEVAPATRPVFGGWSMGALVAFEMARIHASRTGQNAPVVVFDQLAPAPTAMNSRTDELQKLVAFGAKISQLVGTDLGLDRALLQPLLPLERAAAFLNRFKAHSLAPAETQPEEFHEFLQLMIAHNEITTNYRPDRYPGKVVVFRAAAPLPQSPELAANAENLAARSKDLGWGSYTTQPVETIEAAGNHVTMMVRPQVQHLGESVAAWLDAYAAQNK
jgi:amino acid adenylation domain-containing protein